MNQAVRFYQNLLKKIGFNIDADGVRGRQTIAAIKKFQQAEGLEVDGLVGPLTLAKLRKKAGLKSGTTASQLSPPANRDAGYDVAPWMDFAKAMNGWHERRNYGKVKRFLSTVASWFDPIKYPWCGMWMAAVISHCLPDEVLPTNPAGSINWKDWGLSCKPQYGAILVFWRGSPNGWKGHIAFYVGEDATCYHVLGANQRDQVSVTRIKKNRLRKNGSRWPATAMRGDDRTIKLAAKGSVSVNEA